MTELPPANCSGATSPSTAKNPNATVVTVVIPAYNAADTIAATLASVLAQTYRNLEINVVDDGSRDHTARLVAKFAERDQRIRLLQQANAGLAAARNTGLEHARGEFIAPLDADDLWHPTKIEKQLAVMQRGGPHIGAVYCWARAVDVAGRVLFDCKTFDFRGEVFAPLIFCDFFQAGTLLFRRRLAMEIGGYDVALARRGYPMFEDLKFNLDLAERCDFDLVPEFLLGYTIRQGSLSADADAMCRSHSVILEEARAKHPELPSRLFSWGAARTEREYSRVHLERGRFLTGLKLTLAAAHKDPVGALTADAQRNLFGGILGRLGLKQYIRIVRRADAQRTYRPDEECRFVTSDPTTRFGGSHRLAPRRLDRVGRLRILRPQLASSSQGSIRLGIGV